jgi:hypothetical protein
MSVSRASAPPFTYAGEVESQSYVMIPTPGSEFTEKHYACGKMGCACIVYPRHDGTVVHTESGAQGVCVPCIGKTDPRLTGRLEKSREAIVRAPHVTRVLGPACPRCGVRPSLPLVPPDRTVQSVETCAMLPDTHIVLGNVQSHTFSDVCLTLDDGSRTYVFLYAPGGTMSAEMRIRVRQLRCTEGVVVVMAEDTVEVKTVSEHRLGRATVKRCIPILRTHSRMSGADTLMCPTCSGELAQARADAMEIERDRAQMLRDEAARNEQDMISRAERTTMAIRRMWNLGGGGTKRAAPPEPPEDPPPMHLPPLVRTREPPAKKPRGLTSLSKFAPSRSNDNEVVRGVIMVRDRGGGMKKIYRHADGGECACPGKCTNKGEDAVEEHV